MICFNHILKTAGTTFIHILMNNYRPSYYLNNIENFNEKDLNYLKRFNKNLKAISGHSFNVFLNFDEVDPDIKYITFLRDPLKRFISNHYHGIRRGYHECSMIERLEDNREVNFQTKFILGFNKPSARNVFLNLNDFININQDKIIYYEKNNYNYFKIYLSKIINKFIYYPLIKVKKNE